MPVDYPAKTRHWTSVSLMLVQRLQRWPNIKPALSECLVLAGYNVHLVSLALHQGVASFSAGVWPPHLVRFNSQMCLKIPLQGNTCVTSSLPACKYLIFCQIAVFFVIRIIQYRQCTNLHKKSRIREDLNNRMHLICDFKTVSLKHNYNIYPF